MLVLAVLVAIVLHSLNFIIAAFSPAIHAMRLNFLEFFGKFYETGNTQYSPFTKTGGEEGRMIEKRLARWVFGSTFVRRRCSSR